jgi:FtsP/CotA-like multicopper oxidase with cupredoxin domain
MLKFIGAVVWALLAGALSPLSASAQGDHFCPRPNAGTAVAPPPDLFSVDGVLNASFEYYTTVDNAGRTLFCFLTPDGLQSPTLHIRPGDTLNLSVTNRNPPPPPCSPTEVVANPPLHISPMPMILEWSGWEEKFTWATARPATGEICKGNRCGN